MILHEAKNINSGTVPVQKVICSQEIIWERPGTIGVYHVSDFDFVNKKWTSNVYPDIPVTEYQGYFPTIRGGTNFYQGHAESSGNGVRLLPGTWFRIPGNMKKAFTVYLIAKCETVNDAFICSNYDGQNGFEIGLGISQDWTFQGVSRLFSGISALNYHIITVTGTDGLADIYIDTQKIAENFVFSDLPYAGMDFGRRYDSFFSAASIVYQYIKLSTAHEDAVQILSTIQELKQRYSL